jgi:hypothetical protein
MLKRLALLLLLLLTPAIAWAGNAVTSITLQSRANTQSIAVSSSLGGDDDTSAVCKIYYGADTTVCDTGMTMYRRVGTKKYEGRLLSLAPNSTYWYKVVVKDGASTFITPFTSVTTLATSQPYVNRPNMLNYYVNGATGSDTYDGLCADKKSGTCAGSSGPKKTIQAAVNALTASGSPGNVYVIAGHYHETVTLNGSGTQYRGIVGVNGDDGSKPIICGAYESWETAPVAFNQYSLNPDANGGSIWYTTSATMSDSISLVVLAQDANGAANLTYASRRTSKRAMLADSVYVASIGATPAKVARESWYKNGDTLFVRVFSQNGPTGDNPLSPDLPIYLGYRGDLIKITASKWTVANLKLQFAGGPLTTVSNYDPNPSTHGHVVEIGAFATSVSATRVVNNEFYGMSNAAVYAPIWAGNGIPDSVYVSGNTISGIGIGNLYYSETKGRMEESIGGIMVTSARPIILDNNITQVCNGIQTGTGASTETDTTSGCWGEISNNTFNKINDDAIELDLSHSINTLVTKNKISNVGHAFSVAPTLTGPTFIIRNLAWGFDGGIKHGYVSPKADGIVVAIHNTIVAQREPTAAGNHAYPFDNAASDSLVRNFKSYNNIYASAYHAIYGNNERDTTSNYFNYDALAGTSAYLVKWNNRIYSRTLLASNIGWEVNGRDVSGMAVFADTVNAKTFVLNKSVENGPVDAGLVIKGVNTGYNGASYYDAGPDMGYLETAGLPPPRTAHSRKSWLRRILEGIL